MVIVCGRLIVATVMLIVENMRQCLYSSYIITAPTAKTAKPYGSNEWACHKGVCVLGNYHCNEQVDCYNNDKHQANMSMKYIPP